MFADSQFAGEETASLSSGCRAFCNEMALGKTRARALPCQVIDLCACVQNYRAFNLIATTVYRPGHPGISQLQFHSLNSRSSIVYTWVFLFSKNYGRPGKHFVHPIHTYVSVLENLLV